ncbi:hypothetical protein ABC977_06480 [Thioalkalicoccus limnaeus]|uniref:Reverse transcriptase domain-containing protein n=1 Tax=Thioalkalicoccus limnaeus TaxID=120681 RepID=A0ABV4BHY3_9GAMM
MKQNTAIGTIVGRRKDWTRYSAAFQAARFARRKWPNADLLDFCDIAPGTGLDMPSVDEWVVEVDVLSKPKSSGGQRVERLVDIFTGTLLQSIAMEAQERLWLGSSTAGSAFGAKLGVSTASYAAWAEAVAAWLAQQLGKGLAVVIVDFADFFSSIPPAGIERALADLGLEGHTSRALLAIFERINAAAARGGGIGHGLPTMPDDIAWIVADAVLRRLDTAVTHNASVRTYARWVDDCYVACDASQTEQVLQYVSELALAAGLRVNPGKVRVLRSLQDLDRVFLRPEHELLGDLLTLSSAGGDADLDLSRSVGQLAPAGPPAGPESARLVRRLFVLAASLRAPQLVAAAAGYLQDYPGAERQILAYLARLGWPVRSHGVLEEALAGGGYDSRQIFALRLLLEMAPGAIPSAAHEACARILEGTLPAHDFAKTLAFAVLMDDDTAAGARRRRRFAESLGELASAMARRVGLQLLLLRDEATADWGRAARDPSPLVRRFVAFASVVPQRQGAAGVLTSRTVRGWGALQAQLMRRLLPEVR